MLNLFNLETLGLSGAMLILIGYFGLQTQYFNHDDFLYDLINLLGAVFLTIYAYLNGTIPFIILNLIWSLVALKDIYMFFKKKACQK